MHRAVRGVALGAVVAVTVACSPTGGADGLDAFVGQQLSWAPCAQGECATLRVPIDYRAPTRGEMLLALARRAARLPAERLGSLVVNPGGPGASGVESLVYLSLSGEVESKYDIVAFDPRGTGTSRPISCGANAVATMDDVDATPDSEAEVERLTAAVGAVTAACVQADPGFVRHAGTAETVQDLELLRQALGDEHLNYVGFSYGSFYGSLYADAHPDRVGRMVLDSVIDPSLTRSGFTQGQALGFERELGRFVADCARQPDCPLPVDLDRAAAWIVNLLARLDAEPMRTDLGQALTERLARDGMAEALYSPRTWPTLRGALDAAQRGEGTPLLRLAYSAWDRDDDGRAPDNFWDAFRIISSLDRGARPPTDEIAGAAATITTEAPVFGAAWMWDLLFETIWADIPPSITPHTVRAAGSAPILLVSTSNDPATPLEWAQSLERQLENAVLVVRDGDGHIAYGAGSACLDSAVDAYLVTGAMPAEGRVCGAAT